MIGDSVLDVGFLRRVPRPASSQIHREAQSEVLDLEILSSLVIGSRRGR